MRNPVHFIFSLAILSAGLATPLHAAEEEPHTFAVIGENDFFYDPSPGRHQDRHYTQGLKLIVLDRAEPMPCWARTLCLDKLTGHLPRLWMTAQATNFGFVFGQNLYTPEDDRATNLITSDRPYAGWLYLGAAIQRRGETASGRAVLESYEFDLGVIGPEAEGEWAQNTVHQIRQLPTFDGWQNQLRTEPAFVFKYGRAWKWTLTRDDTPYFEVIPHVGLNLGTVTVSGQFGVMTRIGWNIPDDFGVQTIDSPILLSNGRNHGWFGCYIFGEANGRAVGRNAFLDGNLYRTSHRVDKEPVVGDLIYGGAVTISRYVELSWTFATRTREFIGQRGYDQFGSVMLKCKLGY